VGRVEPAVLIRKDYNMRAEHHQKIAEFLADMAGVFGCFAVIQVRVAPKVQECVPR
jgi:hypothetical protein